MAAVAVGAYLLLHLGTPVNIVLITLDTTRADRLGCYGYEQAETPNLDQLAKRGVLFERAYAPAPLTAPSHASMLTGLWPPEHGVRNNGQTALETNISTLAELLKRRGYDNAAFVASFVLQAKFGLNRGFSIFDDDLSTAEAITDELHRYRDGRYVVDSAVKWLSDRHRKRSKSPFFCWIHLYDPHEPYLEHRDEFGDRFAGRLYDGEIAYADQLIGRLLGTLDKLGVTDNTYVIVVGDHGESLGEHDEETHGYMLHESTLSVPLILVDPRRKIAAARIAAPVPLVDVFATLLEAGGASLPAGTSSRSLLPALAGVPLEVRECYSETDEPYFEAGWSPLRAWTTARWRYVRTTQPELYDLMADPRELANIAANHPDKVRELEWELAAFEGKLQPRVGTRLTMSAEERHALESLGYAGGITGSPQVPGGEERLPDIKDMIKYLNRLQHANELMSAGKYGPAADIFESITRQAPNYLKAWLNLGLCRLRQEQYQEAIRWFETALRIDPDCERTHELLAFTYLKLRMLEPAELHVQQLLKLHSNSEKGLLFWGEILQRRGIYAQAMQQYESVLKLNPRNQAARESLEALRQASTAQ